MLPDDKCLDFSGCGRFSDVIGDIQCKKIARLDVAIDRIEIDVIGIDEVWPGIIAQYTGLGLAFVFF